jgi:Flp pilus assembly protein TadG
MRDDIQHMPAVSADKKRRPFLSRFRRNKKGSAAVEFALIGLPFFLILYATVETGAIFFAAASIEGATTDAARLIRTGQAQNGSLTQQSIEQYICDRLDFLPNCMANLHIDVRTFDSFNNVSFPDPIMDGNLAGNFQFQPGSAGDIVLMRAYYEWPVSSPVGIGLQNLENGSRLLLTSTAFRNEPF